MIKRELKINLKNYIIWLCILIAMYLLVFLIYPSIITSSSMKEIDKMMHMFPKEILVAFNLDISSINTAFGWMKTEGFVFMILITGVYSSLLGSNILLKEESDKTAEYLFQLPITRNKIIISKIIVGMIYITLLIGGITIFNYIGISLSGTFDKKMFLLLSLSPLLVCYITFIISLYISLYMHKTKNVLAIALLIPFMSYLLDILSNLSDKTEYLKYISINTLADTRNIISYNGMDIKYIIITIIIYSIIFVLSLIKFNKKELA